MVVGEGSSCDPGRELRDQQTFLAYRHQGSNDFSAVDEKLLDRGDGRNVTECSGAGPGPAELCEHPAVIEADGPASEDRLQGDGFGHWRSENALPGEGRAQRY